MRISVRAVACDRARPQFVRGGFECRGEDFDRRSVAGRPAALSSGSRAVFPVPLFADQVAPGRRIGRQPSDEIDDPPSRQRPVDPAVLLEDLGRGAERRLVGVLLFDGGDVAAAMRSTVRVTSATPAVISFS